MDIRPPIVYPTVEITRGRGGERRDRYRWEECFCANKQVDEMIVRHRGEVLTLLYTVSFRPEC